MTFFKTPSGNIGCAFFAKQVRCDILEMDNAPPPTPASCAFDYGHAFGVKRRGHGFRRCVGDTVVDPRSETLAYGDSIERFKIRCTSRPSALRCANRAGHGFRLSRAAQTVF